MTKNEVFYQLRRQAQQYGFRVAGDERFLSFPRIESEYLNFTYQNCIAGYDWEKMLLYRRLILTVSFRGQEHLGYIDLHKAADNALRAANLLEKLHELNLVWVENLNEKENKK